MDAARTPLELIAQWLEGLFLQYSLQDRAFLALTLGLAALLALTLFLTLLTILLRLGNLRKGRRWARLEAAWELEMLGVLAGALKPEALLERVGPADRLSFVDFLLRYASRFRGEERGVLTRLARPFLAPIAARAGSRDPMRRARAVYTLGALDLEPHAGILVRALDDPSPVVAMIAARALARGGSPERCGAILARLPRFGAWGNDFLVSMLLAMGPAVAPDLRALLADASKPPKARAVAAGALKGLNDLAAAGIAEKVLASGADRDLAAACLELLRGVGRPEHLPVLRAMARSGDFVLRAHAVNALGRLGGEEDVDRLHEAFEDPSPWVALHALEGLRERGRIPVLKDIAASTHPRAALAHQILAEEPS